MDANSWAAVAAISQAATVLVAIGAAFYARGQLREARETRERVAQPEVVVFVDHHKVRRYVDLVIRNFGQTSAYNIQITLPDLEVARYRNKATGEEVRHLTFPKNIAVLAPGQEWRTVWDSAVRRENFKGPLRNQYGGIVEFDDRVGGPNKRTFRNPIALDIKMFWNTMWIEQNKGKSMESAISDIAETLKSYREEHDGIWVYTAPGDEESRYRTRLNDDPEFAFDVAMEAVNREDRWKRDESILDQINEANSDDGAQPPSESVAERRWDNIRRRFGRRPGP